ncbi:hypothetical protein ACH4OX_36210 [Streptomyces roseolus]|uniref:hypothetical protein n=1 Tax=Streptomyces roseolus TaxID=67358 RepID=UPI00379FC2C8
MINEELNFGEAESDILNLGVNASLTILENPDTTFEEVVEECYGISTKEIRSWWNWGQ